MSPQVQLLLLAAVAYVTGSIPFGLIIGKANGIDPRTAGSGNIGATNVGRLLGGKFFALVFTLDLLKGLLPMLAAAFVVRNYSEIDKPYLLWMLVGAGAIGGHLYSLFLNFKGGKGVATSAGVLMGLWPYYTLPGFVTVGLFLAIYLATRTVSIGSILGSAAFPFIYIGMAVLLKWPVFHQQLPLLIFAFVMATLIVWKHRSNIQRLLAGKENKFDPQKDNDEEIAKL